MSASEWLLNSMLNSTRPDWTDVTFTALSKQRCVVPKYQHLWQGWRERLRNAIVTDVEYDDDDDWNYSEVVATHRRFCGWRELFWPTTSTTELVPVGQPMRGSMTSGGSGTLILREPLAFKWGDSEPRATITHMRASNASGVELFDVALVDPISVQPKDVVTINNISLSITAA